MTLQSMCRGDLLPGPRSASRNARIWHECVVCGKQRLAYWQAIRLSGGRCHSCSVAASWQRDGHPGMIDEAGKRYGRWLVEERGSSARNGRAKWWCRCECGERKLIAGDSLRMGLSTQCRSCSARKCDHEWPASMFVRSDGKRECRVCTRVRINDYQRERYRRQAGWYDEDGMATDREMEEFREHRL